MGIRVVDVGNVTRTITGARAVDIGAIVRTIRSVKVLDADGITLRTVATFAPAMTASVEPSTVAGNAFSGPITTDTATAAPTGGLGPYTYSWAVTAFDGPSSPVINSPAQAATSFTQSGLGPSDTATATIRVTITDSLGTTSTADVTANFINSNFS